MSTTKKQINELVLLYRQGDLQQALVLGGKLKMAFPDSEVVPFILGAVYLGLGRLEDARASYTCAVQINPDYAEAYKKLGKTLKDLGRYNDAVASYREALRLEPENVHVQNNLGNTLTALGRVEAAIECYQKALEIKPDFTQVHCNLGNALAELGRYEQAMASYRQALELKPDFAEVHNNMGNALSHLRRPEEAVASFHRAVELMPDFAQAHNNCGKALDAIGEKEAAIESYYAALRVHPSFARAHYNLGVTLNSVGRTEEAQSHYQQVVAIQPQQADAYSIQGHAHHHLGHFDEAVLSYQKALQLRPDIVSAHKGIAALKKFQLDDPHIEQMLGLLDNSTIADEDRLVLDFALAKAFDDAGDYDRAFPYYLEGNQLRKCQLGYDYSSDIDLFKRIKAIYERFLTVPLAPAALDETARPQPIFILGMPRSGTTLVEQILASHSQVHAAGELDLMGRAMQSLQADSFFDSAEQLTIIRQFYMVGIQKIGSTEQFITDKMPLNFQWIGVILAAIPEAKIVHTIRDARATCWSNFKLSFSADGMGFAYDLEDVAAYFELYRDLMAFWHKKFPGQIYDLNYEALTENQERESRALLQHLGIEWEDQCLDFYQTKRTVQTASATQVRRQMYRGSSEEWRKYEKHLGPMLEQLDSR